MRTAGSVALVTGGASGLGRATVERLSAAGAEVVILDLPTSDGAAVAAELGRSVTFVPADVRDPHEVQAAVTAATDRGPLRIVVNAAGIGDPVRTLSRRGPQELTRFARVVEINLIGTFNVIRLSAAAIAATDEIDGERGVIVNTASVAAFDGQIGQASYSASKGGIVGMTLPIARDLAGSRIRVMTVAPGMFATPILRGLSDEARASLETQIPHPSRLGEPDEYAALVEHIVSNPMLNGEVIRLDGAMRMAPR
ncbi:SDR family NAD(P)-dependent oxidoreductase [Lentzea albidocapillata]|uniref:NAD(P)-dependent dehydrogenase, short-chain alcohol dehydrogenase family n=1 Tax=Lentzea albidocapillata TaxID=40571 RepID=A0A1W2BFN8_9PSEU|nr:SDR family NAD(P)-dependent oxidoreductase [Lentzea albidocapillata]SMC71661.1 NAD(P)-dependent dehydrogenase, short-chain alcohol dehydrogenase family [Lentzea albidocapillata]